MEENRTNPEYLSKLRSGDEATARDFVDRYSGVLGSKLRSQGFASQVVDELRQETLMRVYRQVQQNKPIENLDGFVRGVCNNVIHEAQRAEWRYQALPDDLQQMSGVNWRPEDSWISEERMQHVRETLQTMPDKDQRILRGIFMEVRDKDEICRELGVDREYLRVLVHRSVARLKKALEKSASA